MPQDFFYWEALAVSDEFDIKDLEPDVLDVLHHLRQGNLKKIDFKKLKGHDIYRAKISRNDRLIFVENASRIIMVAVVRNHDYQKCKFFKYAVWKNFISKTEPQNLNTIEEQDFIPVEETHFQLLNEDLQSIKFYNQEFINLSEAQCGASRITFPGVLDGPAGSGKSLVLFEILKDFCYRSENIGAKVLFIAASSRLVKYLEKHFWEYIGFSNLPCNVIFQSYNEIFLKNYAPVVMQQLTSSNCISWLEKQLPILRSGINEEDLLYFVKSPERWVKELQLLHDNPETYTQHTLFNSTQAVWVRNMYQQFTQYLLEQGQHSLELWFKKNPIMLPEYNMITQKRKQDFYQLLRNEFRNISGYSSCADYLKNDDRRNTFKDKSLKEKIFNYLKSYIHYLKDNNILNSALLPLTSPETADLVLLDEYPDLTTLQLRNVFSLAKDGRIICAGDTNQALNNQIPPFKYLRDLYPELNRIFLSQTYRSPWQALEVANCILNMEFQVLRGVIDAGQYVEVPIDKERQSSGYTYWNKAPEEIGFNKDSTQWIVITTSALKEAAIQKFGTPLVFTSEEVKGQQFKGIIIYELLNILKEALSFLNTDKEVTLHSHRPKKSHHHPLLVAQRPYFHEVFVAITRGKHIVAFSQTEHHYLKRITEPLKKNIQKNTPNEHLSTREESHSIQEWYDMIIEQHDRGNVKVAENIFNQKFKHLFTSFDAFLQISPVINQKEYISLYDLAIKEVKQHFSVDVLRKFILNNISNLNNFYLLLFAFFSENQKLVDYRWNVFLMVYNHLPEEKKALFPVIIHHIPNFLEKLDISDKVKFPIKKLFFEYEFKKLLQENQADYLNSIITYFIENREVMRVFPEMLFPLLKNYQFKDEPQEDLEEYIFYILFYNEFPQFQEFLPIVITDPRFMEYLYSIDKYEDEVESFFINQWEKIKDKPSMRQQMSREFLNDIDCCNLVQKTILLDLLEKGPLATNLSSERLWMPEGNESALIVRMLISKNAVDETILKVLFTKNPTLKKSHALCHYKSKDLYIFFSILSQHHLRDILQDLLQENEGMYHFLHIAILLRYTQHRNTSIERDNDNPLNLLVRNVAGIQILNKLLLTTEVLKFLPHEALWTLIEQELFYSNEGIDFVLNVMDNVNVAKSAPMKLIQFYLNKENYEILDKYMEKTSPGTDFFWSVLNNNDGLKYIQRILQINNSGLRVWISNIFILAFSGQDGLEDAIKKQCTHPAKLSILMLAMEYEFDSLKRIILHIFRLQNSGKRIYLDKIMQFPEGEQFIILFISLLYNDLKKHILIVERKFPVQDLINCDSIWLRPELWIAASLEEKKVLPDMVDKVQGRSELIQYILVQSYGSSLIVGLLKNNFENIVMIPEVFTVPNTILPDLLFKEEDKNQRVDYLLCLARILHEYPKLVERWHLKNLFDLFDVDKWGTYLPSSAATIEILLTLCRAHHPVFKRIIEKEGTALYCFQATVNELTTVAENLLELKTYKAL